MENIENTIHAMIAENAVNPAVNSQDIRNNLALDGILDPVGFIEDFKAEFKIELTDEKLAQFSTVGDFVRWAEQTVL